MTLLTVLRTSKLLSEELPVMILIYPSKLSHLVKPGQPLRLYHGSKTSNLKSLSPTSDYALRHDFIKRGNFGLKPMLFSTASLLTASLYAIKFRGSCPQSSAGKQFGSVYAFDVKVPKLNFFKISWIILSFKAFISQIKRFLRFISFNFHN